ncbi:unnamed protein product, partial [Meganyctiphanes norvegica]
MTLTSYALIKKSFADPKGPANGPTKNLLAAVGHPYLIVAYAHKKVAICPRTPLTATGLLGHLAAVKARRRKRVINVMDRRENHETNGKINHPKYMYTITIPLPDNVMSVPDVAASQPIPIDTIFASRFQRDRKMLYREHLRDSSRRTRSRNRLRLDIVEDDGEYVDEAAKDRGHSSEEEFSTPNTSLLEHDLGNKVSDPGTVASLTEENCLLRSRLLQLGVALDSQPLSDQEKELLLAKVAHLTRQDASNAPSCGTGGGATAGSTDWDNKSSSSMSEVSVACLQDRIQQMEETHYCTNEELQATLQELEDLREQLQECQHEINQLTEEKQVILESLTQQTEKLTESRSQNDTLKQMLIQHSENSQDLSQCEKTQRLMELLKSAQEDRELLQIKQEELEQQLAATNQAQERFHHDSQLIRDRMKLLEAMVEAAQSEKKSAETQLAASQEQAKATEIENQRLTTALDSAKEKIVELEAAVVTGEKSELADVLERVRQEKDQLEKDNAALQQQLNASSCENQRIKEQLAQVQDDLMVARNNAKTQLDAADWKKSQLDAEHIQLQEEFEVMRNNLAELQMTSQRHLEDKRELKASLSEAQKKLAESFENIAEKERQFVEEKAHFIKQNEEWDQFQRDLLMTVRVANDFKTEAQHDLERLSQENQMLKDKQKHLMNEMEKFKLSTKVLSPSSSTNSVVNSVSSVPSAATDRRAIRSNSSPLSNGDTSSILSDKRLPRPLARGDSRVKSLIESIECATRQTRANSRSSSTSSLCSTSSETNIINNNNNNNNNNKATTPTLKRADTESIIRSNSVTSPLKDFGNTLGSSVSPLRTLQRNSFTEGLTGPSYSKVPTSTNLSDTVKMSQLGDKSSKLTENGTKPISILSKLDTSMRRNSFGQDCFQVTPILEKKDPLASLAQGGGSKRNALLKWCQNKTIGYNNVDITNFSSSWNDGLALCAILDTYLPEKINFCNLSNENKRENFKVALAAAESVGVKNLLDINDMITFERPNWQTVYNYVTSVYCHFET